MSEQAASGFQFGEMLKKFGPLVIGAAAIAGSQMGLDLPDWVKDLVKQWGPAGIFILGVAWYVPRTVIRDFVRAQQDQAVALTSLADGVKNLPQKDHMKFDEILIGQEMVNERLDALADKIDALGTKHYGGSQG